MQKEQLAALEETARNLRISVIRTLHRSQSGHTGGSLSALDIVTALYFYKMRHNPQDPSWDGRDRFVLCKGHAAPAQYVALAEAGYFPKEDLMMLRRLGSHLQGHPDSKATPGVEVCTGSLGQGLSMANGIAMGLRLDGKPNRVYAVLGDGELQEGQVWEAAMAAAHYRLDNLCAIVDANGLQIDGDVAKVMNVEPIPEKFRSFGWHTIEIDGHDMGQIVEALERSRTLRKPAAIVCQTKKGRGVSSMEGRFGFHGKPPSPEQAAEALEELMPLLEEQTKAIQKDEG